MSTQTIRFKFNPNKAIESIIYIVNKIEAQNSTRHSINKLLYFADKTSLERYGRFISGDIYYAMNYGPVPSNTYDLMKEAPADGDDFGFNVAGKQVTAIRPANLDELSASDIECLDIVIQLFGDVPFWKKTQDSHDSAWMAAWGNRGSAGSVEIPIEEMVKMLEDPEDLLEHLQQRYGA